MKEKITITIDKDLIEYVNDLANKDSRSLSSTINKILRDFEKQNKEKNATTTII